MKDAFVPQEHFSGERQILPQGLPPHFVFWLAVIFGAGLRLAIVLSADFPFNDGGLFNTITRELIANGFRMPAQTTYNNTFLPFVYPPLGFYLTGLAAIVSRLSVTELQRWLPLLFSILTIPAFWLLSRAILPKQDTAALATLAFALLPTSTDRLLMGGGITRAPGFFFSLLALTWIWMAFRYGGGRNLISAILFSSLTFLTHPVYAAFVIYSSGVFYLFSYQKRRNLVFGLIIAAGVLAISAPWWLSIINTHGFSPLFGALQSRNALPLIVRVSQLLFFDLSTEYFLEIIGVIALLGLIFTLLERDYFWVIWLVVVFLFERTSPVALAVVPLAMLAGIGGAKLLLAGNSIWEFSSRKRFVMITISLLIYYCLFSSYLRFDAPVLTSEVRQGMAWAAENTPTSSRFLVLTTNPWWDDPATEWFPTLSDRISLTTVQGYEWTSPSRFALQIQRHDKAQSCLKTIEIDCLDKWSLESQQSFDYIFVPKMPASKDRLPVESSALVQSLRKSSSYQVLLDDEGAIIFEKR